MESKLKAIMENVYMICRDTAIDLNQPGDLNLGANAAAFKKIAELMISQGYVLNS